MASHGTCSTPVRWRPRRRRGRTRTRVFERRVTGTASTGTGTGTGTGLAIVRWVAELHGGTARLSPAPGGGLLAELLLGGATR
ncbi:ATP-binding protein [Streptomyces sp. NPDC086989]|uniref:ATP-binding protein n=1 Tax=Streptomyces sp. NPDC086989 TaxID=3365764 RepID=UPI003817DCD2